jgi:histidinol-phosphatase (PHP family)
MAVMPADFHMHTPLCHHAVGTPSEYARAAVERGLPEIGFADHNPMPDYFDDWRMALEDLPVYIDAVQQAREEFPNLPIRMGMEVDYLPGREAWVEKLAGMADWDYFIGSVHYIAPGWDVDNPKLINRFEELGTERVWDLYWPIYEKCIRSGLFDFVGHPDLVKKFGHRPGGDLRRYYEPAVQALLDTGCAFEINTAGLRKPAAELYPHSDFLRMACEAKVSLMINSDAHAPEEVGADFDQARAVAIEIGFKELVRFSKRQRSVHPI